MIYSHMRALVISKAIASSGMMEFLDTFERSREFRDDFDIIIGKRRRSSRHITGGIYLSEVLFFKNDVAVGISVERYGDLLRM